MRRFIIRDSRIKGVACTAINAIPIGEDKQVYEVRILEFKKDRSLAQNALMWLWLTRIAKHLDEEHGIKTTPEILKYEFQDRYIGFSSYKKTNGQSGARIRGTSELNTSEFTDFLNRIEVYARAELGCDLPHPEDKYYEALGIKNENQA